MSALKYLNISDYKTQNGRTTDISLSYQTFGPTLGKAPVVLVIHALTGNSNVIGEKGWWNDLIGENKCIDTQKYTVLAFNIPGNGYDNKSENLIDNYRDFIARDIADIFSLGLEQLKIDKLFAAIGGSVGGGTMGSETGGSFCSTLVRTRSRSGRGKSTGVSAESSSSFSSKTN